ncbi:MAG: ATP-binding protein, partial [Lachnospiraceae bacterium]|nr:ATP-binding protein [Lachnospiraceae bacterium]
RGMDRMLVLAPGILRMILTGVPENRPNEAAMAARGLALVGSPIPRAQRVECHFSLEDVVLPVDSKEALRIACDRVRNAKKVYEQWGMGRLVTYGKGVSLLFSGPPGTGKTMAAQAVAAELAMELYRINLPAVVSKYIGETERNLSEIFENARGRNVVLFFDEADVLFGKRTEIKDSNDKYSNMEAAYLLQRIEEYEGVVVMATNYRRNFDEAFNRRLTAVIDFPFPDEEARKEIWKRSIPAVLFDDSIDTDALAGQYELSGSAIKNSVLYAAFLAASRGEETLSEKLIFEGIREEFKKQGKVIGRKERE